MGARGKTALLLVDVINAFDFDEAPRFLPAARRAALKIDALCERARAERVPVIYVNDNFGRWRSDFTSTVRECTRPERPGASICARLAPRPGDYFVLKPQHSGFYSTALELLLQHLRVHTLVLAGFAANLCIVFTADDAHMRGYQLVVPRDCTAANSPALTRAALEHIRVGLGGDVRTSRLIDFAALARQRKKPRGQPF